MDSSKLDSNAEFDEIEKELLRKACAEAGIPTRIFERMIKEEEKVFGMARRVGLKEVLDRLIVEGVRELEMHQ
jgi:hypothetical protein